MNKKIVEYFDGLQVDLVHISQSFAHPGDVRGGQAVPGEQGIAYAAQHWIIYE